MKKLIVILLLVWIVSACAVSTCPTYAEDGTLIKEEKVLVAKPNHPKPIDVALAMGVIIGFAIVLGKTHNW